MRQYLPNSAEAIARLLAMFVITDGNVDPREIDLLERLHVYDMLGIGRKQFTRYWSTIATISRMKPNMMAPSACWTRNGWKSC
ncbi:hypothetical protein [Paludibacterium denitrificans]|uniref:hypothetical protein n=1 Tax=Paludibacterium denitrificans TaxID=2675226 RepID=UPI001E47DFA5|nr:hypothetical protein [Paludibacterium denitrificans]